MRAGVTDITSEQKLKSQRGFYSDNIAASPTYKISKVHIFTNYTEQAGSDMI